MSTSSRTVTRRLRYHPGAYDFVFAALRHTQLKLGRGVAVNTPEDEEESHISGRELLEGIRDLALERFGLLAATVFQQWGVTRTDDFGRIVFELIERGEMRKTDRDHLSDFADVYDFREALDENYRIEVGHAFRMQP